MRFPFFEWIIFPSRTFTSIRVGRSLGFFSATYATRCSFTAQTCAKESKNSESFLRHTRWLSALVRSFACSLARSLVPWAKRRDEKLFQRGISVTAATRWRTDVWKTIIRNARCANPYNVQLRIYFRAFGSSSSPPSPALTPVLHAARPAVLQWKPLELRKIDKSPAAEQFVYSAARLRANELERITYSYGLASSSFLLEIPAVDDPSPPCPPSLPRTSLHVDEDGGAASARTLHACVHVYYILSPHGALFCHGS